jgi:hypothetical protein
MATSSNTLTFEKLAERVAVERARMDADLDRMTRAHRKLWRAEQALRTGKRGPGRPRKRQPEAGPKAPQSGSQDAAARPTDTYPRLGRA